MIQQMTYLILEIVMSQETPEYSLSYTA